MDFYDLDLSDDIFDALDDMRFEETTPIQAAAIPPILEGRDLIGVAQTGTGKTAAYLLPVLSLLGEGQYDDSVINCVIMSPTRELAQQIDQAMQGFAYYVEGVSSVAVYGGNDGIRYEQEKRGFEKGASIVIATPGRLISHLQLGNVDLSHGSFFILDEADRMLDMGFSDDIMQIAKALPTERQTIMFSATMPPKIAELARSILRNPVEVKLAVSKPAEGIAQRALFCHEAAKLEAVKRLFRERQPQRAIMFAGSKQRVKELNHAMSKAGFSTRAMHSDLSQAERDQAMYDFKSRQAHILIATDIVSRGIDIDDVELVVNFDVPREAEDYVHRIGRTARAGAQGMAVTIVSGRDSMEFDRIERFLGKKVERMAESDAEAEGQAPRPKKPQHRRSGGNHRRPASKPKADGQPSEQRKSKHKRNGHRRPSNKGEKGAKSEV